MLLSDTTMCTSPNTRDIFSLAHAELGVYAYTMVFRRLLKDLSCDKSVYTRPILLNRTHNLLTN